jgi:hypothetical protein
VLTNRLSNNLLTIAVGDGLVRQYCLTNQNKDGSTKYYRCTKCYTLHRKSNSGELPTVKVTNGVIPTEQPVHHPNCQPLRYVQALATELDRKCRQEVREGYFAPREVYNKVRQIHTLAVLSDATVFLGSRSGCAPVAGVGRLTEC